MERFDIKRTFNTSDSHRDNFLSRLFGIFNEDIVRLWCKNPNSKYSDLGRPTLYTLDGTWTRTTLDFGLRNKDGEIYLGELKCELAYESYKFIELDSINQLYHHDKKAFQQFLQVAKKPRSYKVKINREEVSVKGSILIWGRVNESKQNGIINYFNFYDILSIENMVNDLLDWEDTDYNDYINTRYRWMAELMSNLCGGTLHII